MPIHIQWFNDNKTILLWTIEGSWSLNEMHASYSRGTEMCAEVPSNTVIALIDVTGSKVVPSSIFSALSTRSHTIAPNFDMSVVVSHSAVVKSFVGVINAIPALRDKFVTVNTIQEGVAYIEKRRKAHETSAPVS